MECVYCKKTYSSASSLKNHQLSTKSCLKIQKEQGIVVEAKFTCQICKKICVTKQRLEYHTTIHKKENIVDKIEQLEFENRNLKEEFAYEIKIKEDKIKELEKTLQQKQPQKIKIKNTIETNIEQQNNINIFQVMSPDHVSDFFKTHYNLDTLLGGQKALARFVNDGFLKEVDSPIYICGDRSRQKFYMVNNGKKTEDTDCDSILELASSGFPSVKKVYTESLFNDFPENVTEDDIQQNYRDIVNLNEDRSEFKAELSKIVACEETNPKGKLKHMLQQMKDDILPNESHQLPDPTELIRKPDILGISPGKLMAYRDRYRLDKTIHAPLVIMKQMEECNEAKNVYLEFLQS